MSRSPFSIRPLLVVALVAALATGACAGPEEGADAPGGPPVGDTAPAAAPEGEAPSPEVQPMAALTVDTVLDAPAFRVRGTGFPADTVVEVGLGRPASEYEVSTGAWTDGSGAVEVLVPVPAWLEEGDAYVAVVAVPDPPSPDARIRAISDSVQAPAPGALVSVTGTLSDEGVECQALRGDDGTLYTLISGPGDRDVEALAAGTRITVVGAPAEMSFCMQGTTLAVAAFHRTPPEM